MNEIRNEYRVKMDTEGDIEFRLAGFTHVLSQELAANLAAHILVRLEDDAYTYHLGLLEKLGARR